MSVATAEAVAPSTATTTQKYPQAKFPDIKHPLDPLTADEITAISLSVRQHIASQTSVKAIKFITSGLILPPKRAVLAFLGIPLAPGAKPEPAVPVPRKAEVDFIDLVTGDAYNATLTFHDGKWVLNALEKLPEGTQPQISVEELCAAELVIRSDERVQKLAADVGITVDQIHADGWAIGYDDRFPKSKRVQQGLLFARFSQHENLYAHPMDFIPVVDSNAMKVIHIDFPPHYFPKSTDEPAALSAQSTKPPDTSIDSVTISGRERIPPPKELFDFLPDLRDEQGLKMREDIKPLHVVQPAGVSFKIDGNELEWQKWKMHIAFCHREGIALSTVTYNDDGEVRPILYRLSLAEMVVPYAAPEYPHLRKFAFDVGEYGMGTMANELALGCDCLGQIHYLPGAYVGNDGSAVIIKNVICIHEEDAGLLWKHTDYRPGGRAESVRSRRLVISMICTVANYEYIWNYHFYQDGTIELEVRLSGILQVYVSAQGESNPYGTNVAPQVNAHHHQHLFSIRIDPMIDGLNNSVIETDVFPTPNAPTGSLSNFAGNAFMTQDTVLSKQTDGARDFDWERDRRWRIVNPARQHYASGKDVGYALGLRSAATKLLPRQDGWVATRAAFAKKTLWVIKEVEGEKGGRVYPAGKYVPQTREEPPDSVGRWVKEEGSIENEDIIVYATIGTTHIARPEDWPVMPVEHVRMTLKPVSFFKYNPAIDVPGANDSQSVLANGSACCP